MRKTTIIALAIAATMATMFASCQDELPTTTATVVTDSSLVKTDTAAVGTTTVTGPPAVK
jgi:hypothetical protein